MEGMEQMKQAQEKAGNPDNSSEQEETDIVKVGRSETMVPAESQGNSKGLKRKMGAKHKVLPETIIYELHNAHTMLR